MPDVSAWLIVALVFLVLPIASIPAVRRAVVALAERTDAWAKARDAIKHRPDPEQEKLWQWTRRRQLCTALERIERLIATDSWMSATRQIGNRLAYSQLIDELRRTPDVFPTSLEGAVVDLWAEPVHRASRTRRLRRAQSDEWDASTFATAAAATSTSAYTPQVGAVEFLDIGWS